MHRLTPIISAALILAACSPPPSQGPGGPPPYPVGVAAPIERTLPTTRDFTGRIEAIETVSLNARISGQVAEVCIADGAEVKAGDLILRIDPAPFAATVARNEAAVARSEARLRQAQLQFDRSKQLLTEQLASQASFDDAEAALQAAKADLASAKADLDAAKLDLGYTRVTAPIAGRIGKILTTVGNVVQGGGPAPATLLAVINRSDEVYAVFDLDETAWRPLASRLRPADGKAEAVPVAVGLAGEKDHPHAGSIAFTDNQIDSAAGAIRIRAKLPNPDRALTPGAFARVRLEVAPPRPVLLVNERAVQAQLATRYVLVVDDKGATTFRPVALGADAGGGMRVVESGLGKDERIAVNNLVMLFPGRPGVVPLPASMETLQNDAPPAAPGGQTGPAAAAAPGKAAPK